MADYYDQFYRWEALAEFHFNIDDDLDLDDDDNYVYCLCSRVFIRDFVKTYYEEEEASESDLEPVNKAQEPVFEDQSHVHFSNDTCYKVKCDKDEGASCYGSASHTENYCSTDEHDPAQIHCTTAHALQPSDSGADLTYQDCHFDYVDQGKQENIEQGPLQQTSECIDEDYLSEDSWDKFWAIHGERLIWDSWIKKYSDYINPSYLDKNNDLVMDENNVPKPRTPDNIIGKEIKKSENSDNQIRERKHSYDSKVNPYKKSQLNVIEKNKSAVTDVAIKDETWLPVARRRSCSEHDRMLSPRTITVTDSMTNVTKMTISSYDVTSSHVTSESSPTEDFSVSSSSSDDQSNDKTRIANVVDDISGDTADQGPLGELDTEQYWQFLWKKHFGEQYALHYANYIQFHEVNNHKEIVEVAPNIEICLDVQENLNEVDKKILNTDSELQSVDDSVEQVKETETQMDNLQLQENTKEVKTNKQKRKNKKTSNKYLSSVGVLLQNLLKGNQDNLMNSMFGDEDLSSDYKCEYDEAYDASSDKNIDDQKEKTAYVDGASVDDVDGTLATSNQEISNENFNASYDNNDGDDEPPDERPISLKRSHELDEDEEFEGQEKVKSTFQIMGFSINSDNMPKGEIVYRKNIRRLRAPRNKRFGNPKKTYFDDDGNPCKSDDQDPELQNHKEIPTDKDCKETLNTNLIEESESTENNAVIEHPLPKENEGECNKDLVLEASKVALPLDSDNSLSAADCDAPSTENILDSEETSNQTELKRRRRQKQKRKADPSFDIADMPEELQDDPKMIKYWKKRHSLFHRFDEGIKLDRESWFSVTPENVAWHIANKYVYDVVLDAFCGAGGNTIQFARICKKVIAIDIDPAKVEMARHNATIYGVADRIEFIVGDFFELAPSLSADMVFLSPPWGGPKYSQNFAYDLETMLLPKPASELMKVARTISSALALYLPRNTKSDQILSLAKEACCSVEVEQSYLDRRFVAITAYFY